VQSLPQTIREKVYELLEAMLTYLNTCVKDKDAIKKVVSAGSRPHQVSQCLDSTLCGVLTAMYGEKDPRCLLRCFRIAAALQHTFFDTIIEHSGSYTDGDNNVAEKIFNGFACYFPISFRPPPDDPFKVRILTSHPITPIMQ
jgi:DNA repair/transcription protein MET18/MMS19